MYSMGQCGSGGSHRPREVGEAPTVLPQGQSLEHGGIWEEVQGVDAKLRLPPEGKSLHFHSLSLSSSTSKKKETGLEAL